jgi:hypothetical protein
MNAILPQPSFPSLHLDSPILDIPLRRFFEVRSALLEEERLASLAGVTAPPQPVGETDLDRRENALVLSVLRTARDVLRCDVPDMRVLRPCEYPCFFNMTGVDTVEARRTLSTAEQAVRPIIHAHQSALNDLAGLEPLPYLEVQHPPEAVEEFARERVWSGIINSYNDAKAGGARDPIEYKSDRVTGVISRLVSILRFPTLGNLVFVMTYEQILMMRDAMMMRRNSLFACRTLYPHDSDLAVAVRASWRWQERCIESFGNAGYEIAKSVEALAKAYLPRVANDILSGPGDTFDAMMEKVADKERALRGLSASQWPTGCSLAAEYKQQVLDPLRQPYQVAEVFGLQKLSGHPIIDPYITCSKAKKVAQAADTTSPSDALLHRATFMDLFVKEFIKKNRRWPKMSFSSPGTNLQDLHDRGVLSLARQDYSLSDWDTCSFRQELEFNVHENYLDLVDDKAISLLLSEKHYSWDRGEPSTNKRLLIELLHRESFDTAELIAVIEEDRVPVDWLICSLYPKEREFKLAARAFTMLVLEMRTVFAIHEANLSKSVLKYFPSITMTDDKLTVHRRFLGMTRSATADRLVRLMVELDLSSWNLMWRCLITEGVGQELNNLFGLKSVYTTVHRFFKQCCIMMRVAGCRPDRVEELWPPASDLIHYDHAGGLEGIAQKLWSICTVAMIEMALARMPLSYTITDQGDNIVLTLTAERDWSIPKVEQLKTLSALVLQRCSDAARRVHQELKPEECLVSTTTLTYSKVVYVDGVDLPTSIKALSRVLPSSAIDFPSYSAYIASIFSTAYGAAETAKLPERCYWIALVLASLYCVTAVESGGVYGRALANRPYLTTDHHIRMQLLLPSELGGFSIIGPYQFLYKGGADPTSKSIASLALLQDYLPEVRSIIGMMQAPGTFDPRAKIESLIQDPFGFPLYKPPTPADAVGSDTLEVVESSTCNREIREVLQYGTRDYERALVSTLSSMEPFNPVIAHDLYGASVLGSVESIRKFTLKTRTVQAFSRMDPESEIVDRMIQAGVAEIDAVTRRIRSCHNLVGKVASTYSEVQLARSRWSTSGVIPSGVTAHLPIDFSLEWFPPAGAVGIKLEYCTRGRDAHYTRGEGSAYLGSVTKQKTSEHGYKIVGSGYAETAMRTVQNFWSWAEHSQETKDLVDHISQTRCGVEFSSFAEAVAGQYGGNAAHRYAGHIAERGASLLGQSSFAHFVSLNSDNAGFLSATTDDYAIMFQEHLLYLTAIGAYRWSRRPDLDFGRAVLRIGDTPLPVLSDHKISVRTPLECGDVPAGNKLLCNPDLHLRRTGGPEVTSNYRIREGRPEECMFGALVSLLLRAIGGRSSLPGAVDRVGSSVAIALGVVELRGIGFTTFLEAAGCALLDSVMGLVSSTLDTLRANKNINYLIQTYGPLLISPLLPYLAHPDFESDPVVCRLNLGSAPRYDHRFNTKRILIGELARVTNKLFVSKDSVYYRYTLAVYGSEQSEATLAVAIRLLRRKCTFGFITGSISYEECQFLIGSPIRRLSRESLSSEREKLDRLVEILETYDTYRRGRVPISAEGKRIMSNIASFSAESSIHAIMSSADEIVRLYRQRPAREVARRSLKPVAPPQATQVRYTPLPSSSPPLMLVEASRRRFRILAALGRPVSWGSGAMGMWGRLAGVFRGQRVLVVGSGLGACAAAAGIGGAIEVRGHDLRSDFPVDIGLAEYSPPLVRAYGVREKYLQTDDTLATSGDWFDPLVARRLCTLMNIPYFLVVDISSDRGFSAEALEPLWVNDFRHPTLFRCQSDKRTHERVTGIILSRWSLLAIWKGDEFGGIEERVYFFTHRGTRALAPYEPTHVLSYSVAQPFAERRTPRVMANYIMSPLGGATGQTIGEACVTALQVFKGLYHDRDSRQLYEEWTDCLEAAVACELILTQSHETYPEAVERIVTQGYVILESEPRAWVLASASLTTSMSGVIARLIGSRDVRLR